MRIHAGESKIVDAEPWVSWALGSPTANTLGLKWGVVQCQDLFAWGLLQAEWKWSAGPIVKTRIREMRLFGTDAEVLIWWDGATFRARILSDAPCAEGLEPMNETRTFVPADGEGWEREQEGLFQRIVSPSGLISHPPAGRGLRLRQYFEEDELGVLRIAATRFAEILPCLP